MGSQKKAIIVKKRKMHRELGFSVFVYLVLVVISLGEVKVVLSINGVDKFKREDFPPPPHFVFGAGSSAYQIEGAAFEDGRTPSIWDTYVHAGYFQGGNGDVALDGYHKYKEDIQLMVETGFEAYRFSISWSRLIPNGRGPINPKGLQFYNNFINELISKGIEPHVTLFHNDLPQALEDEYGGWLSRKSTKDFVAFADTCFREFGDRVLHWTTFNEPNAFALAGYDMGVIPPARCSSPYGPHCVQGNSSWEPYVVAHNILLAHASASCLYRHKYKGKQNGMIGIDLLAYWFESYTNETVDMVAAQRTIDFWVGWFLNPLVYGDYPETVKKNAGKRVPVFTKDESMSIKGSIDFVAVNHYDTLYVRDKSSNLEMDNRDLSADMAVEIMFFDGYMPPWQVEMNPWGLEALLGYIKRAYGNLPVFIHENGYRTTRNGTLDDEPRVEFMRGFIGSLLDAVRNGSNARGYFSWAFLDVFELLDGYESSYGLYFVDLNDKDLKRQPKTSAKWYSNFLKGSSSPLEEVLEVQKNIATSSDSLISIGSLLLDRFEFTR